MSEKEIQVLNGAEYKLTDFTDRITNLSQHESKDWFVKLRELDAKIHTNDLTEKITFTDDRVVLIAFQLMSETNMFHADAGIREWYIVKRYLDVFGKEETPNFDDLKTFVNLHISIVVNKEESSDEIKKQYKEIGERLNGIDYDILPLFVLDAFASASDGITSKATAEEIEKEWIEFKKLAEMMLEDKLSKAERKEWEGFLALSKMMLNE